MRVLRKMRALAILMTVAILASQLCIVNVNAAEGVAATAPVGTELTGLRVTDLDKPAVGRTLDRTARIRTNENVTWEIPVIWVDEFGNTATTAQPGRTYTPNFIFFIPEGYTVSTKGANGQIFLTLPGFLTDTFGTDSLIFVTDAGKDITYITFINGAVSQRSSAQSAANARVVPFNRIDTAQPAPQGTSASEDHGGSHSADPVPAPAPVPEPDKEEIPEQVRLHCSKTVIEKFAGSIDVLNDLVTLIKNKLEPQAVGLLKSGIFDYGGYSGDTSGKGENALGKQIGLFIYFDKDVLCDGTDDRDPTPANALAYVSGQRFKGEDGLYNLYKYVIGFNTDEFMETDPETGKWEYKVNQLSTLDNTLVHELMHAFMDDYARRGMAGNYDDPVDRYPQWFMEGMASVVENTYQFRAATFQGMGNISGLTYNAYKGRYTNADGSFVRVKYTPQTVYDKYIYKDYADPNNICDLSQSEAYGQNADSAYSSGYLAVVYLSYLTAIKRGEGNALTVPDDPEQLATINMGIIRKGTSTILSLLHDGYSLDSIIRYASSGNGDENAFYENEAAFREKFIKGEGETSTTTRVVGQTEGVCASAVFTSYYLNYLESMSTEERVANGSILRDDQNYDSPLTWEDWQKDPNQYYPFEIAYEEGTDRFVTSTADYDRALQTGGKSLDHLAATQANSQESGTDPEIVDIGETVQQAAKSQDTEPESSDEGSSDTSSSSSDTVDTAVVTEEVTAEPATDPVPVADPVVTDPVVVPVPEATDETGIEGVLPVMPGEIAPDSSITQDATDLCILPTEQDAAVPDETCFVDVPSGDDGAPSDGGDCGGGDDGGSDDSGSDDGGSDDGGTDDGGSDGE